MTTNIFIIKEKKMANNNHNYLYIGMKNCISSPKLEIKKKFNLEAMLMGNIFKVSNQNRVNKPCTITKL